MYAPIEIIHLTKRLILDRVTFDMFSKSYQSILEPPPYDTFRPSMGLYDLSGTNTTI